MLQDALPQYCSVLHGNRGLNDRGQPSSGGNPLCECHHHSGSQRSHNNEGITQSRGWCGGWPCHSSFKRSRNLTRIPCHGQLSQLSSTFLGAEADLMSLCSTAKTPHALRGCKHHVVNPVERIAFLSKLSDCVANSVKDGFIFFRGHFNCTENPNLDRNHPELHPASPHAFTQLTGSRELADVWRTFNSHSRGMRLSLASLDHFLLS